MRSLAIPDDPFALVPSPPFAPADRREEALFGVAVEVLSLPGRGGRHGRPGADRPAFQANRADSILAREAVWRAPGMALTGNRFPFAPRQLILWATERQREPTREMLEVAFSIEDDHGGASMVNSIGASGSVTRSHVHLIAGDHSFLSALPASAIEPATVHLSVEQLHGCDLLLLDEPFPALAVGLRGPAAARAAAMHHLLECRTTPAFNLVGYHRTAWLIPRSTVETPEPHFPQALGSAEFSGRWCCNDSAVFARLSAEDMAAALRLGGVSRWPEGPAD